MSARGRTDAGVARRDSEAALNENPSRVESPDAPTDCPVCGGPTEPALRKTGKWRARSYQLDRCRTCGFIHVAEPDTDYERIYDEKYYRGLGADPLVAYVDELEHPDLTVRHYEWEGIHELVRSLRGDYSRLRWLDYGCGNGGLVRHLAGKGIEALGCEDGWIARRAQAQGIPIVPTDRIGEEGTFDVVTAIEVIEHVPQPIPWLERLRKLLRAGGLLFLTTGNSDPFRRRLDRWGYVAPEIHVSYFNPHSLAEALRRAGFEVSFPGYRRGWQGVLRSRILKNLRVQRRCFWEQLLPWPLLARAADLRYGLSKMPVGWAPAGRPPS